MLFASQTFTNPSSEASFDDSGLPAEMGWRSGLPCKVCVSLQEGLLGLAVTANEPLIVQNAPTVPQFREATDGFLLRAGVRLGRLEATSCFNRFVGSSPANACVQNMIIVPI